MFIITWSQKLLCNCKDHQDAMWHHGFAIIVNMTTCSIFGETFFFEFYINIFE
jgi:hypothetical protein